MAATAMATTVGCDLIFADPDSRTSILAVFGQVKPKWRLP
jgi:hypothetical protein